ncbi:MAG: YbaK/EbsC family protein [Synergistaceae bacterium]|nr:YbaK/EbsC family protein [Synergistaceae bacterium]
MNPTEKVRNALDMKGASDIEIRTVEDTIFTVEDAARTIGVDSGEILKSLVLVADKVRPFIVLMSGSNRVDAKLAAKAIGGNRARMMPPDEVLERYGYHVGGVPPVGYDGEMRAVMDEDLFAHGVVWAAAGTDHAFFPVEPGRLQELTGGIRARVKKD